MYSEVHVNMKKAIFILGLIFVNLICYSQEKKLKSAYTELVEWNEEGEDSSKPFAMEIKKESFEKFLNGRNRDTTLNRKFTSEELMKAIKNNEDIFFYGPVDYHKNNVLERGKYILLNQFTTGIERNVAHPIGIYVGRLISDDEVVTYRFSEKKSNEDIYGKLNKYIYFNTEKNKYMWLKPESPEEFTKALQSRDKSLPEYVLSFQQEWEKIIEEYIFSADLIK